MVARSTRAWIETYSIRIEYRVALSHALRVRGLKLNHPTSSTPPIPSHALRVRGLKLPLHDYAPPGKVVARSTRAWIETGNNGLNVKQRPSRTLYACVD